MATTDGDAPRLIHFLNARDGFVYGAAGVYASHDGGSTWTPLAVPFVFVGTLASYGDVVWLATYPCRKGTLCPYQVRRSADDGRTWSAPRDLPLNFSPEVASAFPSGLLLANPVSDFALQVTTDRGVSWRDIKSPCPVNSFRQSALSTDGGEIWVRCEA